MLRSLLLFFIFDTRGTLIVFVVIVRLADQVEEVQRVITLAVEKLMIDFNLLSISLIGRQLLRMFRVVNGHLVVVENSPVRGGGCGLLDWVIEFIFITLVSVAA